MAYQKGQYPIIMIDSPTLKHTTQHKSYFQTKIKNTFTTCKK